MPVFPPDTYARNDVPYTSYSDHIIGAVINGTEEEAIALMKETPSDCLFSKDEYGRGALHIPASAGKYKVCEFLLAIGADVNEKDRESGYTPLHRAAFYGNLHIMKLLIEQGADVSSKDFENLTALDILCLNHDLCELINADEYALRVYAWGPNNNFNLGPARSFNIPECLESVNKSLNGIKHTSMNKYHSLLLSRSGTVFCCGIGTGGRLGLEKENSIVTPIPLPHFKAIVTMVAAGEDHSLFLTDTHEVWGCGSNKYHQLGVTIKGENILVPKKLKVPHTESSSKIIGIAAAKYHSVLWSSECIYTCGLNGGQIGHQQSDGDTIDYPKTYKFKTEVRNVATSNGATLVSLSGGNVHLLNQFSRGVIFSVERDAKKIDCVGGLLVSPLLTKSKADDSPIVVGVLHDNGKLSIWRSQRRKMLPCFFYPNRNIFKIRDFCLYQNGCTIVSNNYEGFSGTFLQLDDSYESLELKRLPHLYRTISVNCDPMGSNFIALQFDIEVVDELGPIIGFYLRVKNRSTQRFSRYNYSYTYNKLCHVHVEQNSASCNICLQKGLSQRRKNSHELHQKKSDKIRPRRDSVHEVDVQFLCEDGVILNGNKKVLSNKSDYFEAMFRFYWKEATQIDPIHIYCSSKIFGSLLNFLNSGSSSIRQLQLTFQDFIQLSITANQYLVFDLQQIGEQGLIEHSKPRNYYELLQLADMYNFSMVKEFVMQIICSNFSDYYDDGILQKLNVNLLTEMSCIYKETHFGIDEETTTENNQMDCECAALVSRRRFRLIEHPPPPKKLLQSALQRNPPNQSISEWAKINHRVVKKTKPQICEKKTRPVIKTISPRNVLLSELPSDIPDRSASSKGKAKVGVDQWVSVGKSNDKKRTSIENPVSKPIPIPKRSNSEIVSPPSSGSLSEPPLITGKISIIEKTNDDRMNSCAEVPAFSDSQSFPTLQDGSVSKRKSKDRLKNTHSVYQTKISETKIPSKCKEQNKDMVKLPTWSSPISTMNGSDGDPISFMEILSKEEAVSNRKQKQKSVRRSLVSVQIEEKAMVELLQYYGGPYNPDENISVRRIEDSEYTPEWNMKKKL